MNLKCASADACKIIGLIRRHRLDLSNEKATQQQLADLFTAQNILFEREKCLSTKDIVDFLVQGGIAVEVKLHGAKKMSVYRQLKRYATHNEVSELVLITNLSMGLPPEIEGKPVYYASLGAAWL